MATKPELSLVSPQDGDEVSELAALYERLTGNKPTPAEIQQARALLKGKTNIPPPKSQ
jgi:hypothetical protein